MELPNDIKTTLQQLCNNQNFTSNISYYTKVAIDCLLTPNLAQQTQTQCPTPFLFAIAHYISSGLPIDSLASQLPQNIRQEYVKASRVLQKKIVSMPQQNIGMKMLNDNVGNLKDVRWSMSIQNGRQVWVVQLQIKGQQIPIVMKLNYQELSLFSFKINQIVGHIKSIDLQKII